MANKKQDTSERDDRFNAKKGDIKSTTPQCKDCGRCIIGYGLSCTIKNTIPLNIRLNKTKCEDFIDRE